VHIDTARVYPAARLSDRVPFGTGTAIRQIMAEKDLRKKTYSLESFRALKMLFDSMPALYAADGDAIGRLISAYPLYMQEFLRADGFQQRMAEIKSNTGSEHSFRKRFFAGFNAFKIVKYLNFVHPAWLPLRDVEGEFQLLLQNNLLKGFSVENS
jgi:hypothetical protein